MILDARYKQVPNYRLSRRADKPPIEAETIEPPEQLGIPPCRLPATVSAYNDACDPGKYKPLELDDVTTVDLHPRKSNWALPIDQAPFHAYPIICADVFIFGGLKVEWRWACVGQ